MDVAVEVEHQRAGDVLAELDSATVVVSRTPWEQLRHEAPEPVRLVVPSTLEELALDRLVSAERDDSEVVVGVGGGLALDTAKYLALRTAKPLVLVPTALSSLAPFTTDVARRIRRQVIWVGEVAGRVVVDVDLLGGAPAALNRAGAADVVSSASAIWDWRLADSRDRGLPFAEARAELAEACRSRLREGAAEVAAASPEGLRLLAELLATLGRATTESAHRLFVNGSEHTFAQAYEHRFGGATSARTFQAPEHRAGYGQLVGMGTVAMASLQAWYGVSAGGPAHPDEAIELLSATKVAANPRQLGIDEGTFRGLLRHAVRFHVGEFLPWSVLNEADVNWSASEEMWRRCWQVPIVRD